MSAALVSFPLLGGAFSSLYPACYATTVPTHQDAHTPQLAVALLALEPHPRGELSQGTENTRVPEVLVPVGPSELCRHRECPNTHAERLPRG